MQLVNLYMLTHIVWGHQIKESPGYLLRKSIEGVFQTTLNYTRVTPNYIKGWTTGGYPSGARFATILDICRLSALVDWVAICMVGNVTVSHHCHTLARVILVSKGNMVLHIRIRQVCYMALILIDLILLVLLYIALLPFQFCLPQ